MKVGIFDSGLGGLVIAKGIFKLLPKYDYIYFGDTKNLPYGEKNKQEIYRLTKKAVEFLFEQDCQLVVIACNTASASALRRIQKELLPKKYPGRRVLGVIIPTLEAAEKISGKKNFAVIATRATVQSHIYAKELKKIDIRATVKEIAAPKLVPLIENNALPEAENALKLYLKPLVGKKLIRVLILGCTHYPILKRLAKKQLGSQVKVLSQDEIIPGKLWDYFFRHPETEAKLSKTGKKEFYISKAGPNFKNVAQKLFGKKISLKVVKN